jgi:large subunit ribosomal protein L25
MDIQEIQALPRDSSGTAASRRLRREGRMPAVMYGHGEGSASISVDAVEMEQAIHDHNLILCVNIDGEEQNVQIKDLQFDYLGDRIIHVDLVRINLDEKIVVNVPVHTEGDPVGVEDEGGVLQLRQHALEVECLPTNIPESVDLNVEEMHLHDTLLIRDIEFPEGVEPVGDPDTAVVVITTPTEEVEEEEELEAATLMAEPEVIGREEEEEEEMPEEGAPPAEAEEE